MERALQELCRREIRKKSEVVTEALRQGFRARGGQSKAWSLVLPVGDEEHGMNDYGDFAAEWGGENDKVYDVLARAVGGPSGESPIWAVAT
jgi:hypothetical protein